MAASNCVQCDVAIVGSGFAGAMIANELSQKGIKVVILEAGPGVQPNINNYMRRFYTASAKVPESAYPPALFGDPSRAISSRRARGPSPAPTSGSPAGRPIGLAPHCGLCRMISA